MKRQPAKSPRVRKSNYLRRMNVVSACEALESRLLLSIDPIINGTPLDDVFLVVRDGGDPSKLHVFLNGADVGGSPFTLSDVNSLTLNGLAGNDQLIVDTTNGRIPLNDGIHFDGGTGFDSFQLTADPGSSPTNFATSLFVGAVPGSGQIETIDSTDLANPQEIFFENLEPLTFDMPQSSFNILTNIGLASILHGDNAISYVRGPQVISIIPPIIPDFFGRVLIDNYEPIDFRNQTNLTIEAREGNDNVVLNNSDAVAGLKNIIVSGGDGNDTITALAVPPTLAGAFSTVQLEGGTGNDLLDVSKVTQNTTFNLLGEEGDDTLVVGTLSATPALVPIPADTYSGGDGNDTLLIRGTATNDTISVQTVDNVLAPGRLNELDVTTNGKLRRVMLQTLPILLLDPVVDIPEAVHVDAGAGNDQVTLARFVTLPSGTNFNLDGGDGNDTFTVTQAAADTPNGSIDPATPLNFFGGLGDDQLVVGTTAPASGLVTSPIFFDGGAGNDALNLTGLQTLPAPGALTNISTSVFVGALPGTGETESRDTNLPLLRLQTVAFQNLEPVTSDMVEDNFNILSTPGLASILQAANSINYVPSPADPTLGRVTIDNFEPIDFKNKLNLKIEAGAGNDNVVLNNSTAIARLANIVVSGGDADDTITAVALPLTVPLGFAALELDGGTGNDRLDVSKITTSTAVILKGEQGDDTLVVSPLLIAQTATNDTYSGGDGNDVLLIQAMTGNDILFLQTTAANQIVFGRNIISTRTATLSEPLESIRAQGGIGNDILTLTQIVALAAGTTMYFDGGDGNDAFTATQVAGIAPTSPLNFAGGLGDDTLTVGTTAAGQGLVTNPSIYFDGGAGTDKILLTGAPVGVVTPLTTSVFLGALPGKGQIVTHDAPPVPANTLTQTINFENIEPISSNVVEANFNISSTPGLASLLAAANTINYVVSPTDPTFGRVTVDNFEPIEFKNKSNLTIDAGAGNDSVILNNALLPTNLQTITVNGGDGDDGLTAVAVPPTAAGFTTVSLIGGTGNDRLDVSKVTQATAFILQGGDGDDALVAATLSAGPAATNDIYFGGTGTDLILYQGTAGDDTITATQAAAAEFDVTVNGNLRKGNLSDIPEWIRVEGGMGNDTINVTQPAALTATATLRTNLYLDGGDGNDVFNATQATATATTPMYFFGDLGADQLVVDTTTGLLTNPSLYFDGGGDFDSLAIKGKPGGGATAPITTSLIVGALPGKGVVLTQDSSAPAKTQLITFENIEPIVDTMVETNFVITGDALATILQSANTVEYGPGSPVGGFPTGQVTIDNFEPITFQNKANLFINTGAGADNVVLDNAAGTSDTTLVPANPLLTITVDAGSGDDNVTALNVPPAAAGGFQRVILTGGTGNDRLDAGAVTQITPFTLNGGDGNDYLVGGPGNDAYNGGAGDDTLVDSPGNDAFDGGAGKNTLLVLGTIDNDTILLNQKTATVLNVSLNGAQSDNTFVAGTITAAQITADEGDDLIGINVSDSLITTGAAGTHTDGDTGSLAFRVDGGGPSASDRLIVRDDGAGDLVIQRQGADGTSGSVTVGPLKPVDYQGIETVNITPLDSLTGRTGVNKDGRLIVFYPDKQESNDSLATPTSVGNTPLFLTKLSITPGPVTLPGALDPNDPFSGTTIPGDEDWFAFQPQKVGTFRFATWFKQIGTLPSGRQGLPADGNLDIEVYDDRGGLVFVGHSVGSHDNESVDISMSPDHTYYLRVFGAFSAVQNLGAINVYDMQVSEVDLLGPQVTHVGITGSPNFDLLAPKPNADGPTPLVYGLTIDFQDLLTRFLLTRDPGQADVYLALDALVDQNANHFKLVGDQNGVIPIQSVQVVNTQPLFVGQVATAKVLLTFAAPLPDDHYTFTIFDTILDPPGNKLDGNGDGVSGGDFITQFTVDSRPEIGVYAGQDATIDMNGNFVFDPANTVASNRDKIFQFGLPTDQRFSGKFGAPSSLGTYFDTLAAYGRVNGQFRFIIDYNHNGAVDLGESFVSPVQVNGLAVAGNFDGNKANGDELGIFDGATWYLNVLGAVTTVDAGIRGVPIVGDFDGDGRDDLATFQNNVFYFNLAYNGLGGGYDASIAFGAPGVLDRPVAADMDMDGVDDIGLWVPAEGTPSAVGHWKFLVSGFRTPITGTVNTLNHPFTPGPFGTDIEALFGNPQALPLVGNFDPPAPAGAGGNPVQAATTSTVSAASAPISNGSSVQSSAAAAALMESFVASQPTLTPPATSSTTTSTSSSAAPATANIVAATVPTPSSVVLSTPPITPATTPPSSTPPASGLLRMLFSSTFTTTLPAGVAGPVLGTSGDSTSPVINTVAGTAPVVVPTAAPLLMQSTDTTSAPVAAVLPAPKIVSSTKLTDLIFGRYVNLDSLDG